MAEVELNSLIERIPGVQGGRPCLTGSGMPVIQIAVHYKAGRTAEEILEGYPHLDNARVYAGIAYYLANKAAIDAELDEELREFQQAKTEHVTARRRSA